jgi:hypothetical protein
MYLPDTAVPVTRFFTEDRLGLALIDAAVTLDAALDGRSQR